MLTILAFPVLMGLTAFFFPIHGLGLFALSLIIHGLLVSIFGESAQHIPLYGGSAVAITLLLKGHLKIKVSWGLVALLSLFLIMTASALVGTNQKHSLIILSLYMKGFLLSILVSLGVDNEREIKILALFLLLGVFIGSLVALTQYATGTFTINVSYLQRAAGLSEDPNDTAMLLSCGIPLATFWALHGNKPSVRILNAVVLACIIAAMILTKSRGGFVTFVIVMGIIYIKNLSFKTTVAAIIMFFVFLGFGAITGYWERIETLTTLEESGHSLQKRFDLLKGGGTLFFENIVIGVGPGNFEENYYNLRARNNFVGPGFLRRGEVAHNLFLEFAVENGILGIILLLLVFYLAMRGFGCLARGDPDNPNTRIPSYLRISLIALLVSGLFLSQGKNNTLWFLVGLGFAAGQIKKSSMTGTAL